MRREAVGETEARWVTIRDIGHRPVPNEPPCEVDAPVSRDKLLPRQG